MLPKNYVVIKYITQTLNFTQPFLIPLMRINQVKLKHFNFISLGGLEK
jgi:hypothetical protein